MHLTKKEEAYHEISLHTDWSNHRKAAERSSWKKKHEPDTVIKCPNRGKRKKKLPPDDTKKSTIIPDIKVKPPPPPPEEEDLPCSLCHRSPEGYDFPCGHPVCYPCFQQLFLEKDGHMSCPVCRKDYTFHDGLVDEEEENSHTIRG